MPRRGVYARAPHQRKAAQRSGSAGGPTGCAMRLQGPGLLVCLAGPDALVHYGEYKWVKLMLQKLKNSASMCIDAHSDTPVVFFLSITGAGLVLQCKSSII